LGWIHGPMFLRQLIILEGFDLGKMGHHTAEYLHTWIGSSKPAFKDGRFNP